METDMRDKKNGIFRLHEIVFFVDDFWVACRKQKKASELRVVCLLPYRLTGASSA